MKLFWSFVVDWPHVFLLLITHFQDHKYHHEWHGISRTDASLFKDLLDSIWWHQHPVQLHKVLCPHTYSNSENWSTWRKNCFRKPLRVLPYLKHPKDVPHQYYLPAFITTLMVAHNCFTIVFKKWANPGLFFIYFRLFKYTLGKWWIFIKYSKPRKCCLLLLRLRMFPSAQNILLSAFA